MAARNPAVVGDRSSAAVEKVVAIRYGTWLTDFRHAFSDPGLEGDPDAELRMDYFFWVLWRLGKPIVVDTGFAAGTGRRRGRTTLIPPGEALLRLGVDPAAVETVILTHLHYDHVGNLDLFPAAEFVVDRRELDFWSGAYPSEPRYTDFVEVDELGRIAALRDEGRVRPVSEVDEPAPGITLRRVGGHTVGQQIVVLASAEGEIVLASDVIHFYSELEHGRPFPIYHDLEAVHDAYRTLREMEAGGATVVAGHDPLVMERFEPIGEIGVRIA